MQVTVVGAGVSGLSTGIRLLENGFDVKIMAEEISPNTVSDTAAAWWYPFLAEPIEKTNRWASETFNELLYLKNQCHIGKIEMGLANSPLFCSKKGKTLAHDQIPMTLGYCGLLKNLFFSFYF